MFFRLPCRAVSASALFVANPSAQPEKVNAPAAQVNHRYLPVRWHGLSRALIFFNRARCEIRTYKHLAEKAGGIRFDRPSAPLEAVYDLVAYTACLQQSLGIIGGIAHCSFSTTVRARVLVAIYSVCAQVSIGNASNR